MENKSTPPGEGERDNNSNNNKQQYLKQLNKLSHKISKPPIRKPPPPPPPPPPTEQPHVGPQPPVYNINKCDFRDIVQKLTGSPSHSLIPAPSSSASSSEPPTSRLHRIRPPPLSQLTTRPPGTLHMPPPPFFNPPPANPNPLGGFRPISGGPPPLSPLPPLPSVHDAAESPVSAYMRFLRSSSAGGGFPEPTRQFPPLVSPRWNSLAGPDQSQPAGWMPSGCMSTASAYPPLLSPTAFPLSPTVPVPSPKGRGL